MKIKNIILVVAFFGCLLNLSAQSQALTKVKQDSLRVIWDDATAEDTVRLKAISKIALEGFRFKNPDSAFFYAQLQYDFARSIKNNEHMVLALNIQGDSHILKGAPNKALEILNDALKIAEELPNKKHKINVLGNISRVFESKGDFEQALAYSLQVLSLSEEAKDDVSIAKSLINIGERYARIGDLVLGLENLKRAKKIFEELHDKYFVVKVQASIANIYMQQGNLDEALKLINLNLTYFQEIGNKTLMAGSFSNLAGIYARQGDNKKALENSEKALDYFEETNNIPYIALLSQNMGGIYYEEGDLERALAYITKSLKLSEEIKNKNAAASAKQQIGSILGDQGNYTQAIFYGNEALIFSKNTNDVEGIGIASKSLIKSYKATGNYKKAFEMNELYFQMRDSLDSTKNQKALIQLQVQSEYDKQKAVDDIENEKEVALQSAKAKAQRNISLAIGAGLLLTSILAFVIFNRLKVTQKQKVIIEEQKKKVEQSEKYKEQFLANMSHEIRTPMHAISGMLKILDRNEHPVTQEVYLKAMQTSSDNLLVILNDILDLSKIEAGKLEIESIPMNPRLVIENVHQILKFKAAEKGLKLTYEVAKAIPDLVMGDPTRLNQILINLIGNAIKFTEQGTVNIAMKVENETLKFEVKDTGIGIPKNKQEHIFDAFEQAKNSTARNYGGTGLGLSISKQLVELQEGTIWLESTPGNGSSFYVALPLSIANADAVGSILISEEKLTSMAASLKEIRILIAEDNAFNLMIAQDDLSYYIDGVTINTAENGALAVAAFTEGNYDLILMDVQMPEMNGFEATRKIRELESQTNDTARIPIIAMTASLLKNEIEHCYEAGMDNYIPKPYNAQELIGSIYEEVVQKNPITR